MKLAPVIAELRRRCPSFEKRVYGSAQFAAIDESTVMAMPSAYVVPLGESVEEAPMSTGYSQNAEQSLGVIVYTSSKEDETGRDAFDKAEDIKAEILKAICGWCPSDEADELAYDGSTVLGLNRARLAVQYEFTLPYRITDDETRNGVNLSELPDLEGIDMTVDQAVPDGIDPVKVTINLK